jgi:hypothetical protein
MSLIKFYLSVIKTLEKYCPFKYLQCLCEFAKLNELINKNINTSW